MDIKEGDRVRVKHLQPLSEGESLYQDVIGTVDKITIDQQEPEYSTATVEVIENKGMANERKAKVTLPLSALEKVESTHP